MLGRGIKIAVIIWLRSPGRNAVFPAGQDEPAVGPISLVRSDGFSAA
jgi:hypothetical protein